MTKYEERGYCSLCQKWIAKEKLLKKHIPKLGVYAFYCPRHLKQCRLKARGKPMGEVK